MVQTRIQRLVDRAFRNNTYSPAESKEIFDQIASFSSTLQDELDKEKIKADVFHGGSSAKGTFLKGKFDVDLFVRFDLDKYAKFSSALSDILHLAVERATSNRFERVHGSRDYFQYRLSWKYPINFEIVPVLKVTGSSQARNVTDCSPLHVLWLKSKFAEDKDIVKESVAMKLFLKAIGCYGAESYIRGFSGHVVDILISHYGSFEALVKASPEWENHHVIDVEHHFRDKDHVLKSLNESKISPLIVIDPIQPDRNAAAALSKKKFDLFKDKAREFISHPSYSFFVQSRFSLARLKRDDVPHCEKIILRITPKKAKKDVVGSKIMKFYNLLLSRLKKNGFDIFDSGWAWPSSNAYVWIYITKNSISYIKKNPEIIRSGPPKDKSADIERFKKKHHSLFWHDGKIYARVARKDTDYMQIIHKTIKEEKHKYDIEKGTLIPRSA
ncbi:MAG: nucleotidyltransferase domain-containing protein [Candidatus Woesearchaeota archaeon]